MAGNDDFVSSDGGKPGRHGRVVADVSVTVKFDEVLEGAFDIIEHEGTSRMARDLNSLPRAQILVNFFLCLPEFRFDFRDLRLDLQVFIGKLAAELV